MEKEDLSYIDFQSEEGIAWVQFTRPEKLYALNHQVFGELDKIVKYCDENDEIKVIVLKGNDKAFAAGTDVEEMAKGDVKAAYKLTDHVREVQERLADLPKPTIAAVSGYALGGGCEVALCCDFRIAAENAVFGQPEITLGIIPGGGGTQRLPRLIGVAKATELLFLGGLIKAGEAKEIGLVNKVVPLNQLDTEAENLAKKLLKMPSIALRAVKTALRKGVEVSIKEGLQIEQDLFCMLFGTEDQKEGMSAFLEKRKPVFKGR